jgi:Domain of unknown function (DUF4397)
MRFTRYAVRLVIPALAAVLVSGVTAAAPVSAATGTGWIRLTHLSPNTPAVDVYLYSFGDPSAQLVLHHVGYGAVSPYEPVAAGDYSVAMRLAGAAPTTKPVLSTSVDVATGNAYTVAGLGPESALRLQVLHDQLGTAPGQALVRVIQASLRDHVVTVRLGGQVLTSGLAFGTVSGYRSVSPSTSTVSVTASGADATATVTLAAGTVHTLVVLDGANGVTVDNLLDAAGSAVAPAGGAATGLGGTAPRGPGSPLPWALVILAGMLLAVAGGLRLRYLPHPAVLRHQPHQQAPRRHRRARTSLVSSEPHTSHRLTGPRR